MMTAFNGLELHIARPERYFFHFFISPPYARMSEPVISYLFVAQRVSPTFLMSFEAREALTLRLNKQSVEPGVGWKPNAERVRILRSSAWTSLSNINVSVHETVVDLYDQAPPPAIVPQILDAAGSPDRCFAFLSGSSDERVREAVRQVTEKLRKMGVTNASVGEFHRSCKVVADRVFAASAVLQLPAALKEKLNWIIWSALSAKIHFPLLAAYHKKYEAENKKTQAQLRFCPKIEDRKLQSAADRLCGILLYPSTADAVLGVVNFFDAVVEALSDREEVSADDLLPAVALAMLRDVMFASVVYSFFQFLIDMWPMGGLDQRVTYILTTCTCAAQHLSEGGMSNKPPAARQPPRVEQPPDEDDGERDPAGMAAGARQALSALDSLLAGL